MLKPTFDFDKALDNASQALNLFGIGHREDMKKLMVLRQAAVVRMANAPFWSQKWQEASKKVAELDDALAKCGA